MRTRRALAAVTTGLAVAAVAATGSPPATGAPPQPSAADEVRDEPTRVVMIVLDQLRPKFIDAYDMHNVEALMKGGTSFPRAYLGHMASETVISHNVMTSGQLPKNMGWSDEWYRDVDGVLGEPGQQYVSGSMSRDQFDALITHGGYPKISDYLERAYPHRVTATVGQKAYAVNSMSSPGTDIQVTFSSRNYDCDGDGDGDGDGELNWRGPVTDNSLNVPDYIAEPECGRFYIDSSSSRTYGTGTTSPAWMYPLDANRFVPGKDPEHKGGDVWVADAAMELMENERWSGLFLTLGGIDKAGHMWGGRPDRPPYPQGATRKISHLPYAAKVADRQVGRLMHKLRRLGQLDETLVVLTTDHGQLWSRHFHGQNGAGRGNYNWYYGSDEDETYEDPQPAMQRLIDTGNVETSMQDSAIRTWLDDTSRQRKLEAAEVMSTMPGVIASYYRTGRHYTLHWEIDPEFLTGREHAWYLRHGQELVDTEAAAYGPDAIALLQNATSYGVAGDHGGAQRSVQRIPIAFYGAGVEAGARSATRMRSVDIMPTVLRELGIRQTHPTDGNAVRIP